MRLLQLAIRMTMVLLQETSLETSLSQEASMSVRRRYMPSLKRLIKTRTEEFLIQR
jgi:hypothetical protein